MRIGVVQTEPVKGDIEKNVHRHLAFIEAALGKRPHLLMFPELSLTGYEPELAKELATTAGDTRLSPLQEISDRHRMIICAGIPTVRRGDLFVSMIIFRPEQERITYSKQYLYPTEKGLFTPGDTPCILPFDKENRIAPAICYELSVGEHAAYAHRMQATAYMASVLNSVNGVDADIARLSKIASDYRMTALMANYVGCSGGHACAGKSSVWNTKGELVAQLDGKTEGVLVYDTATGAAESIYK